MVQVHFAEAFNGYVTNLVQPNLYKALQRAFSDALLEISEEELTNYNLQPGEQLCNKQTLLKMWNHFCQDGQDLDTAGQNALATFMGDNATTGNDLLMSPTFDFLQHPDAGAMRQLEEEEQQRLRIKCLVPCPCNQHPKYLPMTLEYNLDATLLEMDYQSSTLHISFTDWLTHVGLMKFIQATKIRIEEPLLLRKMVTHRSFLMANWMMDFRSARLGFEDWYANVGKRLQRPTPENSMVKFPPINPRTRIIYRDFTEAGISPFEYHAWNFQRQLDYNAIQQAHYPHLQVSHDLPRQFMVRPRSIECQSPPPVNIDQVLEKLRMMDVLHGHQDDILSEDAKNLMVDTLAISQPATEPTAPTTTQSPPEAHISWADDLPEPFAHIQSVKTVLETLADQMGVKSKEAASKWTPPVHPETSIVDQAIQTAGVRLPPMSRTFWEHDAVMANILPHVRLQEPIIWSDDFMPSGRFSHIYIPPYVLVPMDIQVELNVLVAPASAAYHNLWRQCYVARVRADRRLKNLVELTTQSYKPTPWTSITLGDSHKTFGLNPIERVQHSEAWRKYTFRQGNLTNMQLYDWFFRPIERLVALNMPLSATFIKATRFKVSADFIFEVLWKIAGFLNPPKVLTPEEVVTEMSQVRALRVEDFKMRNSEDRPVARMGPVTLILQTDMTYMTVVDSAVDSTTNTFMEQQLQHNGHVRQQLEDEVQEWDKIFEEISTKRACALQRARHTENPQSRHNLLSWIRQKDSEVHQLKNLAQNPENEITCKMASLRLAPAYAQADLDLKVLTDPLPKIGSIQPADMPGEIMENLRLQYAAEREMERITILIQRSSKPWDAGFSAHRDEVAKRLQTLQQHEININHKLKEWGPQCN
jgi:hypothetical protein